MPRPAGFAGMPYAVARSRERRGANPRCRSHAGRPGWGVRRTGCFDHPKGLPSAKDYRWSCRRRQMRDLRKRCLGMKAAHASVKCQAKNEPICIRGEKIHHLTKSSVIDVPFTSITCCNSRYTWWDDFMTLFEKRKPCGIQKACPSTGRRASAAHRAECGGTVETACCVRQGSPDPHVVDKPPQATPRATPNRPVPQSGR